MMNFLAEQQALIHPWRDTKLQKQKDFSRTNGLITLTKCRIQSFPRMTPFTVSYVAVTLLKQEYTDFVNLLKSGLSTEETVVKLKLSKPPPIRIEKYQYLKQIWKQEQMSSFKDFLLWYNRKDVVPTLEAMQKKIAFYHDKDIDMLKLGCTLPNLANICLHKSTDATFNPLTEGDKDLLEKNSRSCCWWSIYRFHMQSSCWWNFYSKVCKHMQTYCWDWCQPTISLLDVSTRAYRSLYALGFGLRNE